MALADIRKQIDKIKTTYDRGVVEVTANNLIRKIAFDSPQLTYMFSGFSYDRIHQFFAPESSGKSSLSTYMASQLQKKMPIEIERLAKEAEDNGDKDKAKKIRKEFADKQVVIYLDYERTFDPIYAENLGLNTDEEHFILLQPDTLEDGFNMIEPMVKSGSICCIIFDSDAAAPTALDNESEVGATGFNGAKGANTLKEVYKRYGVLCSNYLTPMLVVSQERQSMNVMAKLPTPTGGTAIKFFSSTRNRISKLDTLKNGDDAIGIQIRVRNYKNKTGIPNRDAIMNLYFDGGFNSDDEYFDFLVMFGLIHKAGGWFDAADIGMPKLQGSAKVKDWLKQNPDIYDDLKKKVDSMLMSKNVLDENNIDYEKAEQNGVTVEETKTPAQLAMEALGLQENPPDLGL
jgi:recombination protein RecA